MGTLILGPFYKYSEISIHQHVVVLNSLQARIVFSFTWFFVYCSFLHAFISK